MSAASRIPRPSAGELAFYCRITRHFKVGLKALLIPFFLSGIVLASGKYLSGIVSVDQNSFLFRLWPFNRIYLQQFVHSPYTNSDIKWFFTVVSSANFIWLIFVWKLAFELCRRDVEFPREKTPVVNQFIVRLLTVSCVILAMFIFVCSVGFHARGDSLFGLYFKQSVTVGAIKVVMALMFSLYFGASLLLEFGGLRVRYLLSKAFGWFMAECNRSIGEN